MPFTLSGIDSDPLASMNLGANVPEDVGGMFLELERVRSEPMLLGCSMALIFDVD